MDWFLEVLILFICNKDILSIFSSPTVIIYLRERCTLINNIANKEISNISGSIVVSANGYEDAAGTLYLSCRHPPQMLYIWGGPR